jgi:hypothetical protein
VWSTGISLSILDTVEHVGNALIFVIPVRNAPYSSGWPFPGHGALREPVSWRGGGC